MPSRRLEFFAGIKAELPILLGVSPFGMIYGVLALGAGLPAALALAMSSIVFAGSAQFVGAQLIGGGAPGGVLGLWLWTQPLETLATRGGVLAAGRFVGSGSRDLPTAPPRHGAATAPSSAG